MGYSIVNHVYVVMFFCRKKKKLSVGQICRRLWKLILGTFSFSIIELFPKKSDMIESTGTSQILCMGEQKQNVHTNLLNGTK